MFEQGHHWELGCTSAEGASLSVSSAIFKFKYTPKYINWQRYNETIKTLKPAQVNDHSLCQQSHPEFPSSFMRSNFSVWPFYMGALCNCCTPSWNSGNSPAHSRLQGLYKSLALNWSTGTSIWFSHIHVAPASCHSFGKGCAWTRWCQSNRNMEYFHPRMKLIPSGCIRESQNGLIWKGP